jgi:hypothetical protein
VVQVECRDKRLNFCPLGCGSLPRAGISRRKELDGIRSNERPFC